MLNKLREAEEKFERMNESLADPTIVNNQEEYRKLMREVKNMTPLIEQYRAYKKQEESFEEVKELLADSPDPEFRILLEEEYRASKQNMEALLEELKILLLPKDPNDNKSVIIEIRAGAGGEEAALFAADLYRMYTMYADTMRYKTERISYNETGLGGFREISFSVDGEGVYSRFKFESGVHRVQRVPETESQGRIQTSTVTVAVLPEAEEVDIVINPADIVVESCKSSGAGGQHINKTESAVRLTHKPSGIVIECQEERSQFKNRDKAMKMLRAKLFDIAKREQDQKIASERRSQVGTGDRSERIRTYNFPQGRITDHRIGLTLHSLENFLNGDIGEMLDALARADNAEKLKNSEF